MADLHLTDNDLKQLQEKGISQAQLEGQLRRFAQGFPYLHLVKAASDGEGVVSLEGSALDAALGEWERALNSPATIVSRFVPASGAASRMFKSLFAYLNTEEMNDDTREVLNHITDFAFFDSLNRACMLGEGGKGCLKLIQAGKEHTVIEYLLTEKGLNYGHLPKALLLFHRYPEGVRTAVEEQLGESSKYARNADGTVRIHFTLSPEHIEPFQNLMKRKKGEIEERFSCVLEVTHSIQRGNTDTIAVDMENQPMRTKEGALLFRPGGHGALIYNLNEINSDIIFIKNIDNVTPQPYWCDTLIYKKAIGGYLVQLRNKVYKYMALLGEDKKVSNNVIAEIKTFLQEAFSIDTAVLTDLSMEDQANFLRRILNRPIRVCGMVRNTGEPGGGPYIVKNENGTTGLQILESTQINMEDPVDRELFETSQYFNPVDLVLCVKDYRGNKFDLLSFVDEETGFISHKSQEGRELKALELPGLWNGAMSNWLTAFVAVPVTTFNPVKKVNDLLRPSHQLS